MDLLIADLHRGPETEVDIRKQHPLPDQLIYYVLFRNPVIAQGSLVGGVIRVVLLLEFPEGALNLRACGSGISVALNFQPHQGLLHHAARRGAARQRAEIGLHAIEERRDTNLAIDIACRDRAIAHRNRDAIDNRGRSRQGAYREEWSDAFQKVCPIEKKY